MNTREQAHIFLTEEPEQVLPRRFKKVTPPSVQSEQKKYFDELRERIGEDKFKEMTKDYENYERLKKGNEGI